MWEGHRNYTEANFNNQGTPGALEQWHVFCFGGFGLFASKLNLVLLSILLLVIYSATFGASPGPPLLCGFVDRIGSPACLLVEFKALPPSIKNSTGVFSKLGTNCCRWLDSFLCLPPKYCAKRGTLFETRPYLAGFQGKIINWLMNHPLMWFPLNSKVVPGFVPKTPFIPYLLGTSK